jgi:EAL domain-containing protein (putative c-di-GMP-specific phosphodiesterase class I)
MSSVLKPSVALAGSVGIPFASYAQIVRMLVPPAERVGFYDAHARALWINDGVEESEFRMHVELSLARARHPTPDRSAPPGTAGHQDTPAFVFPIRNTAGVAVGALGIACRDLPPGARFRNAEVVERMLAPLMEILAHAWPANLEKPAAAVSLKETGTRQATQAGAQLKQQMPTPALLRKALLLATELIDCAFGAVVLPHRPFTLTQRVSPDESDLTINSAVDSVRAHVLRWIQVRTEPLVVNSAGNGRSNQLPYKLLTLPVREASGRVVALIMLFRNGRARDFVRVDIDELTQLAAGLPADALAALAAEPPVVASVAQPRVPAPVADTKAAARAPAPVVQPATVVTQARERERTASPQPAAPIEKPPLIQAAPVATPAAAPRVIVVPNAPTPAISLPMDERVRTALREGGFDLYAQKITALRDVSRSPRFEVLLRMREGSKLHTPATFFNAAENSKLLPEVDCWVITALMQTLRKRAVTVRASGLEFSINIAGQSLATEQFSEFIVAEVCRSAIPAGLLVFEISERTALEHEDAMEVLSARLRDIGCRIALDNCRSGLGTLDPFNKWPVSRVKIDASLIRNVATSARSASQIRAVAQIAADRGIETVAEGVETQMIHERLLEMGIDYAQGFHLGRPEPLQTLFGGEPKSSS